MRIGVYGATGVLGRLVTERLTELGAELVLVGRSREALERLSPAGLSPEGAAQFGPRGPRTRFALAPLDDRAGLRRAFDLCRVVINCAPATACGDRVVRAAIEGGMHYVDAAGEQQYIAQLFELFGPFGHEATRDSVIVPALGFDYAIGDCLARLAARTHEPAQEVLIAYCIEGSEVSGNSVQAAMSTTLGREVVFRNRQWQRVPFEWDRSSFDFPAPFGRRHMSRYGSGEVITVPRHTDTRSVRTLITSSSLCPHPTLLPIFPVVRPLVGLALRTPARALVGVAAKLTARARSTRGRGGGSTEEPRRFIVAAQARGLDGSIGRASATGSDFHGVTAALLAHGAVWLSRSQNVQWTQKGGGVYSPAMAFEPEALLNALSAEGVSWSIG